MSFSKCFAFSHSLVSTFFAVCQLDVKEKVAIQGTKTDLSQCSYITGQGWSARLIFCCHLKLVTKEIHFRCNFKENK